ncbi:MAG TPA: efflux transporter outer membrane subunit, partial [Syntrophorhabdales bacterium]|nr:efflux transporter outer membrane subunit [Syntrophorhabdales bacterium]
MKPLFLCRIFLTFALLFLFGCAKVGPDFVRPKADVLPNWLEAEDSRIDGGAVSYRSWWRVFDDPVLDRLVDTAYRQSLSLRIAGVRVLEARAQLGIAIGGFFPQSQQAFGSLQYNRVSEHSPQALISSNLTYTQSEVGLSASWELDFWGKFRRAIESADAGLMSTVFDYDNALVSLTADAATSYILIKTLEKRISIARQNAESQTESLKIAEARFHEGTTSQRDVEQATTILNDTEGSIPTLETQLRQAKDALCVLMGLPPSDLTGLLSGSASDIPAPPPRIAVGIPADLLRRRPDIRSAEYQAMAQGAQIGVAKAELYPAFSLSGTFGFLSSNVGGSALANMFRWGSRTYTAGPGVQWNLFNYGTLTNNVRVQDARFQQLLIGYQNAVLKAQQEVEDNLVAFLKAQKRAEFLGRSAGAARRSLDLAVMQYREGVTDFTTVLTAQQALLNEQDNLATTLGSIS